MNYLKRGFLSVIRKPMKALILFLVVFILGNLMAGAVSIKKTLNTTEANINKSLQPIATIELDWETLNKEGENSEEGEFPEFEFIKEDAIKKIGSLSYVKYYDYNASWGLRSKTLKSYVDPDLEDGGYSFGTEDGDPYFSVYGVEYHKILKIETGEISLKEGRVFSEEEISSSKTAALVSSKFAEANNLTIGSTLPLYNEIYEPMKEDEVYSSSYEPKILATPEKEYEVIGIFETKPSPKKGSNNQNDMQQQWERQMLENTIIVPNNAIVDIMEESEQIFADFGEVQDSYPISYEPIFILKESKMLDDFKEEASSFLPKYSRIIDTTKSLENIKKPMESINGIATIVLYASIGVAILILSLLTTLFLHDRRHEIGIYMAMGERKGKVIAQILAEVITVSLISMTLALIVGNFITKDISKTMLIEQVESQENNDNGYYSSIDKYTDTISQEDLIDNYNVSLDGSTIIMFYGISVITIVVSTIIPTMYILRLKPKEILM